MDINAVTKVGININLVQDALKHFCCMHEPEGLQLFDFGRTGGVVIGVGERPCFMHISGFCPLQLPIEEVRKMAKVDEFAGYCVNLAYLMCHEEYFKNIYIKDRIWVKWYSRCNHYEVAQGNHRACIARRLGLKVPVIEIEPNHERCCGFCSDKESRVHRKDLYFNPTTDDFRSREFSNISINKKFLLLPKQKRLLQSQLQSHGFAFASFFNKSYID